MNNLEVSQGMADVCNLLINATPSDGPMVRGVLGLSIEGIKHSTDLMDLSNDDCSRLKYLVEVHKVLCQGKYNILPATESDYKGSIKEA